MLIYVLSIGPAIRLYIQDRLEFETFHEVYTPILWLCERNETFHRVALWYVNLWTPGQSVVVDLR